MKRSINIICVLLFLFNFAVILNAATITGDRPIVRIETDLGDGFDEQRTTDLQGSIDTAFETLLNRAQEEVDPYEDQDKLAKGCADAAIMATNSASLNGYQNYDLFAVAVGGMMSVQGPDSSFDLGGYADDLKKDGDIYFGAALVPYVFNIGINAGKFGLDNFYFNIKFGHSTFDVNDVKDIDEIPKLESKTTIIGVGVNYSIIGEAGVLAGLARWRGITFGTGFYYHKSSIDMEVKIDKLTETVSQTVNNYYLEADVVVDPSVAMKIDSKLYIVPVEVATSFQFLWIMNFSLGAGIDLTYGESDIELGAAGSAYIDDDTGVIITDTAGSVSISNEKSDSKPTFVRPRLMAGLGLNISAVKIDVPVIYYPSSGIAVGLTAAVVW